MKYKDYKKGYSALRRIINDEELEFSRQFAKFTFSFSERYNRRTELRGIWNAKTNNVVGFINSRGNVFIRTNSIYAEHLIGSKNKVIKNDNLRPVRSKVSSHIKNLSKLNLYAEKGVDRLIDNGDKPKRVFLFEFEKTVSMDERFIYERVKELLKKHKLPNTLFAINNSSFVAEEVVGRDSLKVYLDIEDYLEAIEREERLDRIKTDIARTFISNVRDIAQHAVINSLTMNPLQFTYNVDGEDTVTGRILLNRLNMTYPANMPIADWLGIDTVKRLIRFEERLGSLAERGIDEMARRDEGDRLQETTDGGRIYTYAADALRIGDAGHSVVRPTLSCAEWSTNSQRGTSTVEEVPASEFIREQIASLTPVDITAFYQELDTTG